MITTLGYASMIATKTLYNLLCPFSEIIMVQSLSSNSDELGFSFSSHLIGDLNK